MEPLILLTIFLGFFCSFLVLPLWIRKAKNIGLVGKDMHKKEKRKVAEVGGIGVLMGIYLGILSYIALNTFYFQNTQNIISIFALLCVVLFSSMVGIFDDILGWKNGLSRKIRIIIILFSAIPLMVINAGESSMMGIEFGLLYPLIIIPIGILGATTTFNFIAGYNGLEASQGMLLLTGLAYVTYFTGNSWLSVICLCAVAALFAFYIFNMYPARVFPGDTLTYPIGALIASVAILGNIEKIAIFFFLPYILEFILKLRGGLVKESFGKLNKDGSLDMPYKQIYGLEHLAIYLLKKIKSSKKAYEKEVVFLINGFQIVVILLTIIFVF